MLQTIVWLFRIVWACRVGVLSGGAGIVLFAMAVPAQNLLEDVSFNGSSASAIAFWVAVYAAIVIVWALPIFHGARIVLDDNGWIFSHAQIRALGPAKVDEVEGKLRKSLRSAIIGLPLLLGLAPFVAVALGITISSDADKGATALLEFAQTSEQSRILLIADGVACLVYLAIAATHIVWRERTSPSSRGHTLDLPIVPAAVTALIFAIAYIAPIFVSVWLPRALLVPLLFGSLVLLLCLLQRASHRVGLPLTLFAIALVASVTAANTSFHSLRTLPRVEAGDGRLKMAEAIERWMKANGCKTAETCNRRPLVVAIDGGASRAAFTAATFIGSILDRMPKIDGEAATPGRRIFAISGVSGGAFGAATVQAALADAQEVRGTPAIAPCRTADRSWFGYAYRPRSAHDFRWQECLQALASGDFLSPTIVGLAFRDFIAPRGSIEDRAVLLEQSWERHYDRTLQENAGVLDAGRICKATETGLCRRLGHVRAFLDKNRDGWVPLLLLNGTSVRTGRRIIASDIAASRVGDKSEPLFPEAFDLAEIMSSPCPKTPDRLPLGTDPASSLNQVASASAHTVRTNKHGVCGDASPVDGGDIRLSTAALTSARFPLISPWGAFAMKNAPYGDRVVDGGYFENSGLTTALEIVDALEKAGLKPLLLSIANEPAEADEDSARAKSPVEARKDRAGLPRRPSTTPLTVYSKYGFFDRMFGTFSGPFDTLVATRDGHASEAEGRAETRLGAESFFRMHVDQKPDLRPIDAPADYDKAYCAAIWRCQERTQLSMAKVSMSWWLSALVQADLDAQKCSTGNQEKLGRLMKALAGT